MNKLAFLFLIHLSSTPLSAQENGTKAQVLAFNDHLLTSKNSSQAFKALELIKQTQSNVFIEKTNPTDVTQKNYRLPIKLAESIFLRASVEIKTEVSGLYHLTFNTKEKEQYYQSFSLPRAEQIQMLSDLAESSFISGWGLMAQSRLANLLAMQSYLGAEIASYLLKKTLKQASESPHFFSWYEASFSIKKQEFIASALYRTAVYEQILGNRDTAQEYYYQFLKLFFVVKKVRTLGMTLDANENRAKVYFENAAKTDFILGNDMVTHQDIYVLGRLVLSDVSEDENFAGEHLTKVSINDLFAWNLANSSLSKKVKLGPTEHKDPDQLNKSFFLNQTQILSVNKSGSEVFVESKSANKSAEYLLYRIGRDPDESENVEGFKIENNNHIQFLRTYTPNYFAPQFYGWNVVYFTSSKKNQDDDEEAGFKKELWLTQPYGLQVIQSPVLQTQLRYVDVGGYVGRESAIWLKNGDIQDGVLYDRWNLEGQKWIKKDQFSFTKIELDKLDFWSLWTFYKPFYQYEKYIFFSSASPETRKILYQEGKAEHPEWQILRFSVDKLRKKKMENYAQILQTGTDILSMQKILTHLSNEKSHSWIPLGHYFFGKYVHIYACPKIENKHFTIDQCRLLIFDSSDEKEFKFIIKISTPSTIYFDPHHPDLLFSLENKMLIVTNLESGRIIGRSTLKRLDNFHDTSLDSLKFFWYRGFSTYQCNDKILSFPDDVSLSNMLLNRNALIFRYIDNRHVRLIRKTSLGEKMPFNAFDIELSDPEFRNSQTFRGKPQYYHLIQK